MAEGFVYGELPDEQKRELCLRLLEEFGAQQIIETRKGELRHKCTLPLGGHTDRNSVTASINYLKLTFKCYVCDNSGGFLWWIATNRGEDVEQSRNWLQAEAGIGDVLDLDLLLKILDSLAHGRKETVTALPSFDERVLAPWTGWKIFHPYLTLSRAEGGREVPEATLAHFGVGYCDHDEFWRYYQRIILPLRWQGHLVGWQARRLWSEDPELAKYKNSPDFPRDRTLYGELDHRDIVLVESPLSVLRHWHHLPMLATMGASISEHQVPLLHRYRRIVLWYDNDKSGYQALSGSKDAPGLIDQLRNYCDLMVVQSPYAKADAADLTDDEADELVAGAVPYPLWRQPRDDQLIAYTR